MEIAGRVAVVTGAAVGTGRAIALALAAPPPVPLAELAEGVLRLIRDDSLADRSLLLLRGEPARLL